MVKEVQIPSQDRHPGLFARKAGAQKPKMSPDRMLVTL
jgi:hypothetical protein